MPSSSKVHKTCSSPSILRMMESGSDPFAKADCNEEEVAAARKSFVLEDDSSRASDSGVTSSETAAAPGEVVVCPVINSVAFGEDAELGCSRGILPASDSASAVAAVVETPKLGLSSPKLSPPVQLSFKVDDDDKENKGGDVFATPLSTPFGNADASEVAGGGEGEGGGGGFTSILKSFWKRTSWTWDDQEKQHCGDKEEEEEGDAAAGSESKQTDVETDMNKGDGGGDGELQVGYRWRVQEVIEDAPKDALPAGGGSSGAVGGDSYVAPEAVATGAVNNSSRMPGECCRRRRP